MNKQKTLQATDIKKSLNFIYGHLGNILGEVGIIMAEINDVKRKIGVGDDSSDLNEIYDRLSDNCKKALKELE